MPRAGYILAPAYMGRSKVISLEALSEFVPDGSLVGLGGAWFSNHPMAAVRQLVRDGVTDLHAVETMGSIDVDLLVAAGSIKALTFSMVSFELFGLAPHFRHAVEAGELEITEMTGCALNLAIDAGARNVPFLPMALLGSSEIPARQPDHYADLRDPFTGAELLAVRALRPDVAIIHALRADTSGNAQFDGPLATDPELARAARSVIITCEEIVDHELIQGTPSLTRIPGFLVDAVIEAPFGAHPTSHIPSYGFDAWSVREYVAAARNRTTWDAFLSRLKDESEDAYRARVVPERRRRVLRALARRRPLPDGRGREVSDPPAAGDYTADELMISRIAAEVDDSGVTVLGSFTPLAYAAYMLAVMTHAPNAVLVGFNSIGMLPVELNVASVEGAAYCGSVARWSFLELTNTIHLGGRGLVECVSPAQVDGHGRINASVIGPDYAHPKVRLPGGTGAPEVVQNYEKLIIYFGRHDRRTLVDEVDFATGGRWPLSDHERRARGLLAGPMLIVTPLAVLIKEDALPFAVQSVHQGVDVEEVIANTGFELRVPPVLPTTRPPTPLEVTLLRETIDPLGTRRFDFLDAASRAAHIDDILELEWARADGQDGQSAAARPASDDL